VCQTLQDTVRCPGRFVHDDQSNKLVNDVNELIRRITADLRLKQDLLQAATPVGTQLDHLPVDFTYVRLLFFFFRQ
jgi:hypothetical protein